MLLYVARRVLLMIPLLFGISILVFMLTNLLPGDPVRMQAGLHAPEEVIQQLREKLGLNKPLLVQYGRYLSRIFRGDLGISLRTRRPVLDDLKRRFPATLELTAIAFLFSLIGGILMGMLAAVKYGRPIDHISRLIALGGVAVPAFWLGIMMQLVFFFWLRILPSSGQIGQYITPPTHVTGMYVVDALITGNWTALGSSLAHLVMPAVVLSLGELALISRTVRSSILDVMSLDYVQTARSKGIRERTVIFKHVLRNALIPVVTMSGMNLAVLLGGAVLVETVFTWPGMGLYVTQSILALDFPAVTGFTLLIGVIVQFLNLFVDVSYVFLDPRIRHA